MKKNALVVTVLWLLVVGCSTCKGVAKPAGQDKGEPPVILGSFAAELIRPGATWRVYLKANDADGDINYIAAQITQPGVGYYPTDFTYIKGADREGFAGYLFLTTPRDSRLVLDNFKLEILLRDCEGNKSESVYLSLRFDLKSDYRPQAVPEKWQTAANRRLGAIQIDIVSSDEYNAREGSNNKIIP